MEHGRRPTASVERGCCLVGVEMVLHVVRDSREGLRRTGDPIQNSKFPHQSIHPMTGVQTLGQHRPRTSPGPHFANAERDPLPSSPMGQAAMFLPETLLSISKPLEKREKNGASRHLQRLRQGSGADMPLLPRGHLLLTFLPRHESPTARPDLPNPRNTPTKSQPARATGSRGAVP